jgi:hypothetical protein
MGGRPSAGQARSRYRKRGLIGTDIADELMGRIVKDDITARQRPGK